MTEYPKALYLGGWHNLASYRQARAAADEAELRSEGYKTLTEHGQPDNPPAIDPMAHRAPAPATPKAEAETSPPATDRMAAARAAKAARQGDRRQ